MKIGIAPHQFIRIDFFGLDGDGKPILVYVANRARFLPVICRKRHTKPAHLITTKAVEIFLMVGASRQSECRLSNTRLSHENHEYAAADY